MQLFYFNMEPYDLICDIIRDVENINKKEKDKKTDNHIDTYGSVAKQSAYCEILLYLNDKRQEVRNV